MKRGFLRSFIGTISLILLIIGTIVFTTPMQTQLSGSESANDFAQKRAEHFLDARIKEMDESGELPGWVGMLPLPEETKEMFAGSDATIVTALLKTDAVHSLVAAQIATVYIRVLAILLAFVVSLVLIIIARVLLHVLVTLPLVKTADRVLGFFFGLAKALLLVWIAFAVIRFAAQVFDMALVDTIEDSVFLRVLYQFNPIYAFLEKA